MKRGNLLGGVALKMYFVGSLTSFESCKDKPKSGSTQETARKK